MTMTVRDAFAMALRHILLASAAGVLLLTSFEFVFPGSVLPFVDVTDLLLPAAVVAVLDPLLGRPVSGWVRKAQLAACALTVFCLIGILLGHIGASGAWNIGLCAAAAVLALAWLIP